MEFLNTQITIGASTGPEELPVFHVRRPRLRNFENLDAAVDTPGASVEETDPSTIFTEEQLSVIRGAEGDHRLGAVEEAVGSVDWGDFDVSKLVDLLQSIRAVLTGMQLHPYQADPEARLYHSILTNDGEELTTLISRQAGKTEYAACAVPTMMVTLPALAKVFPDQLGQFANGFWVGMYAPTGEQVETLYGRTILRLSSERAEQLMADPDFSVSGAGLGRLSNGSFVFRQSAGTRSAVESKTFHLIICDESQKLSSTVVEKSLSPMLASTNGTLVMLGSASYERCYFYDSIEQNRARDTRRKIKNHFEADYTEVQKYNTKYRAYVAKRKERLGEQSDSFQMSYLNRWMFTKGMAVTEAQVKQYAMANSFGIVDYSEEPVVVGIDQARKANRTIVTVGGFLEADMVYADEDGEETERHRTHGLRVLRWLELSNVNWSEQRALVSEFLHTRFPNVRQIVVDSSGVGDVQLGEFMEDYPDLPFSGYVFSGKSKEVLKDLFYSYFWNKRLQIPTTKNARATSEWRRFWLELLNARKVTKNGCTYFEKADTGNIGDDYVDSLLLCIQAHKLALSSNPELEFSASHLFSRSRNAPRVAGKLSAIRSAAQKGEYYPVAGSHSGTAAILRARARSKFLKRTFTHGNNT